MRRRLLEGASILFAAAGTPRPLLACAVCFGQNDGNGVFRGLTWGLVVLLGATFLLLGALAVAVVRIEKNRAASEAR